MSEWQDPLGDHEYPADQDCADDDSSDVQRCPACGGLMYADAEQCASCGEWIIAGYAQGPGWRLLAVVLVLALLGIMLIPLLT